jgi:hypothetical protein
MIAYCVEIVVLNGFAVFLAKANNRKENALRETGQDSETEEEKCAMAFRDLTDLENPLFKFSY